MVEVASFAAAGADVAAGHGIGELITRTTRSRAAGSMLWPEEVVGTSFSVPKIGLIRRV